MLNLMKLRVCCSQRPVMTQPACLCVSAHSVNGNPCMTEDFTRIYWIKNSPIKTAEKVQYIS